MENNDETSLPNDIIKSQDESSGDDISFNKSTDKVEYHDTVNPDVQASRTNMAIFHFIMTVPKWSIGLFLFLASYTSPLSTTHYAIQEPIQRLRALVQMESKSYQDCVQRSIARMDRGLEEVAIKDRRCLEEFHHENQKIVIEAQQVTNACSQHTRKARFSLVQWQYDSMPLPWTEIVSVDDVILTNEYDGICTIDERNQTERLLGKDFRLYEDQISDVIETYVDDSQNSLELLQAYGLQRFEYDWKYFVMDRIQPALEYLAAHSASIQSVAMNFEVDLSSVQVMFRSTLVQLETTLEEAKRHIDILQSKLEEFSVSINDFHFAYDELYGRLIKAVEFSKDLLPPGTSLPPFLDLTNLPIAEVYLPSTSLVWSELELNYHHIHEMLDEAAHECMLIMLNVLENVRAQAGQQLRGTIQDISRALVDILELKDYNPPKFHGSSDGIINVADELEFQSKRGEETRKWVDETMTSLGRITLINNANFTSIQGPNISAKNYSYVNDGTNFEYLGVLFPSISIPDLLNKAILWITSNTWLVEILIQAYRLWRLESVYSRGAIPKLPEIDYGDGDDNAEQPRTKYMIIEMIMKGILCPRLIIFSFFCLPLCFISIFFWFPHVQKSCVATSDGTFIARNFLSPLLINQANAQGNARYLHTEFECQSSQRQWCTEIGTETETRYQADWSALHSFQMHHNQSLDAMGLMADCLDLSRMNLMVIESCCGLKGYGSSACLSDQHRFTCPIDASTTPPSAFLPLGTYLSEATCQKQFFVWDLADPRYDCANLTEVCRHIPCTGVNEDLIRLHTIQTDCKVELYVVDCCYFLLAVFFHAVSINLISTLLFRGLRQVQWRRLCPNGIKLKTQLRENGDLAKGFELEDRSVRIANAVKHFEILGKAQIGMGTFLFVAYGITTLIVAVRT
jgi:hypothetical protein